MGVTKDIYDIICDVINKRRSQSLKQPPEKISAPLDLSEIATKILSGLFDDGPCGSTNRFMSELGLQDAAVEFYFDELKERMLISKRGFQMGANGIVPVTVCITAEGRAEVMKTREMRKRSLSHEK